MRIGIVGTRGIPNRYGGFEQFATRLAPFLARNGHDVLVYNTHDHPWKEIEYEHVSIIHKYNPERILGPAGQFIYDLLCIIDSRKRSFDVILQLGYTSSAVWGWLIPKSARLVTNMDGIEYHRAKYSNLVKRFLKFSERLVVKRSDHLIADAPEIARHLKGRYQVRATYIPYGADIPQDISDTLPRSLNIRKYEYFLLIARMQADNHIDTILKAYTDAQHDYPLVVIGNMDNAYGRQMKLKYNHQGIRYLGAIFDQPFLNQLRQYCALYFHGHSAGGTNPSLLEAMACGAPVCAHNNPYNRHVLDEQGLYFNQADDLAGIIQTLPGRESLQEMGRRGQDRIRSDFSQEKILKAYEDLLLQMATQTRSIQPQTDFPT